jgi:hypothetical protein
LLSCFEHLSAEDFDRAAALKDEIDGLKAPDATAQQLGLDYLEPTLILGSPTASMTGSSAHASASARCVRGMASVVEEEGEAEEAMVAAAAAATTTTELECGTACHHLRWPVCPPRCKLAEVFRL